VRSSEEPSPVGERAQRSIRSGSGHASGPAATLRATGPEAQHSRNPRRHQETRETREAPTPARQIASPGHEPGPQLVAARRVEIGGHAQATGRAAPPAATAAPSTSGELGRGRSGRRGRCRSEQGAPGHSRQATGVGSRQPGQKGEAQSHHMRSGEEENYGE